MSLNLRMQWGCTINFNVCLRLLLIPLRLVKLSYSNDQCNKFFKCAALVCGVNSSRSRRIMGPTVQILGSSQDKYKDNTIFATGYKIAFQNTRSNL